MYLNILSYFSAMVLQYHTITQRQTFHISGNTISRDFEWFLRFCTVDNQSLVVLELHDSVG